MIKAVIFDCYGVLVVNGWDFCRDHFFSDEPKKLQVADDLHKQFQYGFLNEYEFGKEVATLAHLRPSEIGFWLDGMPQNEPLIRYIKKQLKPNYKIGMLSNAARSQIDTLFSPTQLELYDEICLSAETGLVKPGLEAYIAIANLLGVETSECLFIDDQLSNINGAIATGMQAYRYGGVKYTIKGIESVIAANNQFVPPATN